MTPEQIQIWQKEQARQGVILAQAIQEAISATLLQFEAPMINAVAIAAGHTTASVLTKVPAGPARQFLEDMINNQTRQSLLMIQEDPVRQARVRDAGDWHS